MINPTLHRNLPYLTSKQSIRLYRILIPHLVRRFHPKHRHLVLKPLTGTRPPPIRERIRKRQILRHQTELPQRRALVPRNMLVVEPVAADIHNGSKGDLELAPGWRNARQPKACTQSEHLTPAAGGGSTYSQSTCWSCVVLNINSSMTRSSPTVRLVSSRFVLAELQKMKLLR